MKVDSSTIYWPLWGALAILAGCASIPPGRAAIDSVEVVGAHALDPGAVADKLATAASPRFLGLLQGVGSDYEIYDASVLQRDLARVERFYRGHGFFEAHARVGRILRVGKDHVRVQIVVDEGPPVENGPLRIDGLGTVPPSIAAQIVSAARAALPERKRFDESSYAEATVAVAKALTDRGYAYAKVQSSAQVDLASHTIAYVFAVSPGIPAHYGTITLVGLDPDGAGPAPQEIQEGMLRRVMRLREGQAYSTADMQSAEQALLDLEVFSAAHVHAELSDPPSPVVPLVVQLEPTKLRALRLGVGAEFDALKTDVHLLAGWEDHNLLGNLRDFTVDFSPGLVLYPLAENNFKTPNKLFFTERLRLQLRQPGFLEPRTTAFVRPEFNIYPLLVKSPPLATDPVIGYREPKGSVGVERRFGKHFFATLAYDVQAEFPFQDKAGECPPGTDLVDCTTNVPQAIVLAFPQLTAQVDFKDDPVHPHSGFGSTTDVQAGAGTAADVRIEQSAEGYIPIARGVTLALTASAGVLLPLAGYSGYVQNLRDEDINPAPAPLSSTPPPTAAQIAAYNAALARNNRDIETVYFRGFFGGGPNDNRGFPLRGVAPHGWVPFLNPSTASSQLASQKNKDVCVQNVSSGTQLSGGETNPPCFSPIGGFSMWEASAELRFAVSGPLGVAGFCDTGDVSERVLDFRFKYLHMSCGAGLRYDTPVGPIRLDIAYRIPFLQLIGCANESDAAYPNSKCAAHDPTFGVQPTIFGVPLAFAFGIGEAF